MTSTETTAIERRGRRVRPRRVTAPVLPAFFGRYLLLERLGSGGMGVVYRASTMRGPDVALKVLTSHREYPDTAERFAREIAAMAQLSHPAIISILDHGEHRGQPYYVMELLEGVNLRELVEQRGAQPTHSVLRILDQLGGAIAATHAAGLIHRDVKPGNVMIDPDVERAVPRLLDFGLVYSPSRDGARITLDDSLLGTPGYLAPEGMISSRLIAQPADLYGLALTAVHLLLGRPVFRPADLTGEVAHRAARARAFDALPPIPPAFRAVLHHALAYRPEDRCSLGTLRLVVRAELADACDPA